jgi:hypothetical protein
MEEANHARMQLLHLDAPSSIGGVDSKLSRVESPLHDLMS